ncbi:hypothetical protein ROA7023_04641 [Roseisalinus antarcticus]|uniref:Uncharacterized protein n=1 Tax=Roseisalinus antarcticus TaxID=254357 RepID=A0A1Y5U0R1_9RHOB|nr:hypothetical protein ROA7023_04641 [Roseisalinus antarcticus]
MQVHRHLVSVQQVNVQRNGRCIGHHPQPRKTLATLNHRPHGHGLQPVEIGKPARIRMIGPAQPEHLQPFAHCPVRMGGLRLDPRADDIAHQAVHCSRDPRVVPCIPPGTSRRRARAREDRRVQPIDRPRPLPPPPATRSVETTGAREVEEAMEEGPHGWQNRLIRTLKLLGMFGKHFKRKSRTLLCRRIPGGAYNWASDYSFTAFVTAPICGQGDKSCKQMRAQAIHTTKRLVGARTVRHRSYKVIKPLISF